jgi:hypothetical protein
MERQKERKWKDRKCGNMKSQREKQIGERRHKDGRTNRPK